MLQRVRDLKVQYNNGTLSQDDKDAIAAEVFQIAKEVRDIGDEDEVQRQEPARTARRSLPGRRQRQRDDRHDGGRPGHPGRRHRGPGRRLHERRGGHVRHVVHPATDIATMRTRMDAVTTTLVDSVEERVEDPRRTSARSRTASSTA